MKMKKVVLVALLLCSSMASARTAPNPADYTVNVHISSSRLKNGSLRLKVIIDGKKYEMVGNGHLLVPGDYKAKLARDDKKNSFERDQSYEFLLPDKKTRWFLLAGIAE